MINKFSAWFNRNKRTIGMVVAGCSILAGVSNIATDHTVLAVFNFVIAIFILVDLRNEY